MTLTLMKLLKSGKTNSLFNLINQQPDIDQIYILKINMKQNINS